MKYIKYSLLYILLMAVVHAKAANVLVNTVQIEAGKSSEIVVGLTNSETNLTGYQMSLYLPQGITLKTNSEGDYQYTLSSRHKSDHTLTIREDTDGSLLIVCFSISKKLISGTSGELLCLPINVASSVKTSLQGSLKNILFSDTSAKTYTANNVTISFNLNTVKNISFADANVKALCVANWDTNGDGELSETEAAAVTNLGTVFKSNKSITTFNELQYFTGLTSIGDYAFYYCTALKSVKIPNSVTSFGFDAFYYCSSLSSITIPNGVTTFGNYSFSNCSGLTSITFPNSLTSIGYRAFNNCSSLTSISIPSSVTSIDTYAFGKCSGLSSITVASGNTVFDSRNNCNAIIKKSNNSLILGCKNTIIPTSVTSIGSNAFYGCSNLSYISIPNSVTSIGSNAFESCSSLASITIPSSVISIGSYSFSYCSNLSSITVANGNTVYDSHNNCNAIITKSDNSLFIGCKNTVIPSDVTSIRTNAFYGCTGLSSIIIPDNITTIGGSAFYNCSSLSSISLPNSITGIGNSAFSACYNLVTVKAENPIPVSITQNVFSNRKNAILYVPNGSKSVYSTADYWKEFKEIIESNKCATPVIAYKDGKLVYSCETTGVDYVTSITTPTSGMYNGNNISVPTTYIVSVYAKKSGYDNSEVVTKQIDIRGLKGDVNADGVVSITDAVSVVNIILDNGEAPAAPAMKDQ